MTAKLILPKGVKRITFIKPPAVVSELNRDAGANGPRANAGSQASPGTAELFARSKRRKKKMSAGLRGLEKWTRRYARAVQSLSGAYIARHDRSNRKKRDGWLRDYMLNMTRANREGLRKLQIPVFKL